MARKRGKAFSLLWGLIIGILWVSTAARGAEISLLSDTHVQFRRDARANDFVTLYQYLDLEVQNIIDGRLSLYSSGWLRYDFDSRRDGDRENDDIRYAYLAYSPLKDRRLIFHLGRHFVFEGIASEQIDGVSAKWEIIPMVGLSAFGGVPVETDFDDRGSDYIYGSRVFLRIAQRAELGLSYLRELNDASSYREEVGVDVWAMPVRLLEVQGHSSWNAITDDWMEHAYAMHVYPIERLTLSGFISHIQYDDAFFATTLSAFFPDIVGRGEEVTKVGPAVEYQLTAWLTGTAEYTRYDYKNAGPADFYGVAMVAYFPQRGLAAGASLHRMDGDTKKLRYVKARAYATKSFERFEISIDGINLHYDESFRGLNDAYAIHGALTYKVSDSFLASASAYFSRNPDFDEEYRFFLRLIYKFRKDI